MLMLNLCYEARHSGELWIHFDHLGLFNVHRNLDTEEFQFFATTHQKHARYGRDLTYTFGQHILVTEPS